MVSRTMNRFDLHRKHPAACLHAVGLDASSTRTLLLSLSTIAGAKISNPPWVNFQSAGWVSFQSATTSSLQLEVIAEGVETHEQYITLLDLGFRSFQGYLFGRPMPLIEFERLIPASIVNNTYN